MRLSMLCVSSCYLFDYLFYYPVSYSTLQWWVFTHTALGLLGTLCGSPLWGCRFPRPKSWASGGAVKKSFFEILSVATALVVMRTRLVHRTVINSASGKLILSIGIESCTFWDQTPISIQLSSTTFCAIPCTIFPCIWSDNIPPFHEDSLSHRSRDSVKTSILQPGKDPTSGLQQPTSGPLPCPFYPTRKSPQRIF